MQIDARLLPVALYCGFGRAPHGGDFPEREATDKLRLLQPRRKPSRLAKLVCHLADLRELPVVDSILREGGVRLFGSAHQSRDVGSTPHPHCVLNRSARKRLVF
jgi:hypothetical protein